MRSAVMPVYNRANLAFERGDGPYLFTAEGDRYLDFISGIAVVSLGHCHPHLVAALEAQTRKLWHCSNIFQIEGQERLARRLTAASFADMVFFCNSGAEAVEAGIKLVRKYHYEKGAPERYRILACEGAFHGRTLGGIAAGGQEKHLRGFGPPLSGFDRVPFGNLNTMRAAVSNETAAILVEPIQGEGGLRRASDDYLKGLREIADEFGILLFFDEVQSGMGRSGRLFAHEWAGVVPDVMAVAKGLGSGFPVGACLATAEASMGMTAGSHGSTFGGNPLAMAVGNAVLDILLEKGFLDRVVAVGDYFQKALSGVAGDFPALFTEVRGYGLLLGLKYTGDNREFVGQLRDHGLLAAVAGDNVVRFAPPLTIERAHVDEAIAMLRACSEKQQSAKA